jgi:hypothetical protein
MTNNKETKNGQVESNSLAQIMKEPFRTGGREALYEVVEEKDRQSIAEPAARTPRRFWTGVGKR